MRTFSKRSHANVEQSYGPELAGQFRRSTPGKWSAIKTRDGWRALRLDSMTPARSASYEKLRDVVLQDWKAAVLSEQRDAAIRALVGSYKVLYEPPAHHH